MLYRKLKEFQQNPLENTSSLKSLLWMPLDIQCEKTTITQIDEIEPIIELVENTKQFDDIRRLIHSFEWVSSPGRLMRLYVKDKPTDKILGILTIASDMSTIGCRDEWIGWDNNMKMNMGKLKHTSIASSIVPTQPFGFNMLGGKLIACMATSNTIRNLWEERYGDELIGMTTTSLFGSFSMYNNIPIWKKMGSSKGKVLLKPDKEIYSFWNNWLKENHQEKYRELVSQSSPKQKVLSEIYRMLGLKISDNYVNQSRGVYFSSFYKNTRDFLSNQIEIDELEIDERFTIDYIINWWKPKAINRYRKLLKTNKFKCKDLWYENMDLELETFKSWLIIRGKKYYE